MIDNYMMFHGICQYLADGKSCPVVHPAWALADFVDRPSIV
jgi:hypothetical protein